MLLIVASLLLVFIPAAQVDAAEYSPINAHLEGPLVVTTGSVTMYELTMVGGPAEDGAGNYSYEATLSGDGDTYGAFFVPGTVEPTTNTTFFINLTAPAVPQTMTIDINCTSTGDDVTVWANLHYKVVVVEPVVLMATITNTGNVSATDIPLYLQIYEDGRWVEFYNTTLDLAAGASYEFLYNWTALDLKAGEHHIRMLLDPNNEVVTFEGGASVYETTIYYKVSGYDWINSLMWVLIAVLGVTIFLIWRRPSKGKGKRRR